MIEGGKKLDSEVLRCSLKNIKKGTEVSFVDASWFSSERDKNILKIVSENIIEQIGEGPYKVLEIVNQ